MRRLITFGEPPTAPLPDDLSDAPDWVQANPRKIDRALERALARPAGGWYAVDERSPEPHPGELGEEAPAAARDLAESVADRESEIEPQNRPGVRD